MTTRGILCNNPLNIMDAEGTTWQGQVRPTLDIDDRLCTFDTVIDGVRAGAITLLSYFLHDGRTTAALVLTRFAPPPKLAPADANNTQAYINFMCHWCSVQPDAPLTMTDPAFLKKWVGGQIHFEQGSDVCTDDEITQGITEALQHG